MSDHLNKYDAKALTVRELFTLATDESKPYNDRVVAQNELSYRAYYNRDDEARQALSLEGLPAEA